MTIRLSEAEKRTVDQLRGPLSPGEFFRRLLAAKKP